MFATRSILALLPLAFTQISQCAPSHATFTLSEILYHQSEVYSTPAHLATYGGYIDFNLTNSNPAVPGIIHCSAVGMHLTEMFFGEFNYTCASPPGVATNFTFDRPTNGFTLNQTWSKDGKAYLASGKGAADLSCQTTTWTNPNWTMGQLYHTENIDCAPGKLVIKSEVKKICD